MRSPAFPPRRPSHLVRYIIPTILLLFFIYYYSHGNAPGGPAAHLPGSDSSLPASSRPGPDEVEKPIHGGGKQTGTGSHPIDWLIKEGEKRFDSMMEHEATTLEEAAATYRKRRGRHPPPGFKAWYEFAKARKAVMVEDFWDQIYHDLTPFWGVEPQRIRKEAWDYEMTISVRDGNATASSDWFWTLIWLDMVRTLQDYLPDMDLALNAMDEPRLVVPWEEISGYVQTEKKERVMPPAKDVISEFQKLPPVEDGEISPKTREKNWEDTAPYWDIARRGCPPDSPARKAALLSTFDAPPDFQHIWAAPHQHKGYVSNFTLATDFCHQPDLQGLEGIFMNPISTSATKVLFPMFGGSKLATNNEILLPAPMYWNEEERFTGGDDHGPPWSTKLGDIVWRGVATGGENHEDNWRGFQRHRFVSMNNGTKLEAAESGAEAPYNFDLPSKDYHLAAQKQKNLAGWVSSWSDVGFTDLFCDPALNAVQFHCNYTDPYFEVVPGIKLSDQFTYKYLPDIDGNSFSGRYLGFLRSTSLPIKSTMWREWHDSRLVAWKHFVPMDNRFGDYFGIMEYFLGYGDKIRGHDSAGEKIAMDGKAWAEKVLRKEDMQIYVFRLLLEYARVSDAKRDKMGWVEDLL